MRFVIMADGKGKRWNGHLGVPKHLVEIEGEQLIKRTVGLLRSAQLPDKEGREIIVTSHDERYEFEGCRRHEPVNNVLEIDRFTEELITDNMCFLYGDTYYTEDALKKIIEADTADALFFGNQKSIVAIKIWDSGLFKEHKHRVRELFLKGELGECKGWQMYQVFTGQDLSMPPVIGEKFVILDDRITDINSPDDYYEIVGE